MARRIEPWVSPAGRALLDELLAAVANPQRYRATMVALGRVLAARALDGMPPTSRVGVVCTAEDADFLARGFVSVAQERFPGPGQVALVCFWNDRQRLPGGLDIAPILRRYVEPLEAQIDALVVLKSIVADGCTVKTNIQEVIASTNPKRVIVSAPVVLTGAADELDQQAAEAEPLVPQDLPPLLWRAGPQMIA